MSKPVVYTLSGLGADERIFSLLELDAQQKHLPWIPFEKAKNLKDYAMEMAKLIKDKNPILLGVSFGGMLAVEIAKLMEVDKLILVSSVKTKDEIPFNIRLAGKSRINRVTPDWILNKPNFLLHMMFGIKKKASKELLKTVLKDTDPKFMKWCVEQIVDWENEDAPKNCFHIHGDKDRILPYRKTKPTHKIEDGGHFCVVEHAKEVSEVINQILSK